MIQATDNDILKDILETLKDQLNKVSETANWRHELYKTGNSREYPFIKDTPLAEFCKVWELQRR